MLGEMVQMDGSHHAWFEDRGGPCVLMSYIDDATGKPLEVSMSMRGRFRRWIASSVISRKRVYR